MKKDLKIFGAGIRGQIVADLIISQFSDKYNILGYYDDNLKISDSGPFGFPILGNCEQGKKDLPGSDVSAFIAFGTYHSAKACELFLFLRNKGVYIPNLVSPSAFISPSSTIGSNTIILPGVFIGCQVVIGNLCCLHGGAIIEHHCRLDNNILVAPGVNLASKVHIESHCFLGVGSMFIPMVKIKRGCFVGAGSLVLDNFPAHSIIYGHPAKHVKNVEANMEVPSIEQIQALNDFAEHF